MSITNDPTIDAKLRELKISDLPEDFYAEERRARLAEQQAKFTLRCVSCKRTEKRLARECTEQPFCSMCHMPMTLEEVGR